MNKEFSNRNLILVAVLAIALSAFSMVLSFGKIGVTGAASDGYGYANVTVLSTTDILVVRDTINFTNANPGETRWSHKATDVDNCAGDLECGINITNEGSSEVNISVTNTEGLFTGGSLDESLHYLFNVTIGENITAYHAWPCSMGYAYGLSDTGGSGWRAMPTVSGTLNAAICGLNNTDGYDWVSFDLNITIPNDEPAGQKDATITFTATEW